MYFMSVSYSSVDVCKYLLGCEDIEHGINTGDLAEVASVCLVLIHFTRLVLTKTAVLR